MQLNYSPSAKGAPALFDAVREKIDGSFPCLRKSNADRGNFYAFEYTEWKTLN
nr:MAG TPA_asm: hypothetical protein [Caudoviricetes sp.]